jgi:methionyl-tRNA formyltransferase
MESNQHPLRIVFMGTPTFAVASLQLLVEKGFNIVGVITAPDKPAGRGQQLQFSAVKTYALQHQLKILQPEKLKDASFIDEYQQLKPDLNIVVAFRMLPEIIWNYPVYGTFNLHASLLPQYRGAAPINRAIMNGEKETGLTTFFLQHEIDTGKVIIQQKIPLNDEITAGELHDQMMPIGAEMVVKTVEMIEKNAIYSTEQSQLIENDNVILNSAPKIFKEDCLLDWSLSLKQIHDQIRGLSPYPTAFTVLINDQGVEMLVKIYKSRTEYFKNIENTGIIESDGKSYMAIHHPEGRIFIEQIQAPGRKQLAISEFLRGFSLLTGGWKVKVS